ncbi:MAG: pseudouridine synthase [Candidatus Berkelbacteria bacterium]
MNINKYIASAGIASRRGADELIKQGKVRINEKLAIPIHKVGPNDRVFVDGKEIKPINKKVYLAFNKPVGVICTTDPNSPNNIIDHIKYPTRIFPIGRLDVNSSGLILLTNDGDLAQEVMKGKKIEKEYVVQIDKSLDEAMLTGLANGSLVIDGFPVLPAKVTKLSDRSFDIVIVEGRNRQIRRMCEAFRTNVTKLERVRIGQIELKGIKVSKYIEIDEQEIKKLLTNK